MKITISRARKEDLSECFPIAQTKELEGMPGRFPTLEDLRAGLRSNSSIFLVAKHNNKVVGFALGYIHSRRSCYLDLLAVDKEFRNQGIGTKLLLKFEAKTRKKNIDHLWLIAHLYNSKDYRFYIDKHFKSGDKFLLFSRKV